MTKAELKKYLPLKKEAEDLRMQAERLEEDIKSLKVTAITGMPRGNQIRDKIGELVAKVESLREEYLTKYDEALRELYKIEDVINTLDNLTERTLIRKRYIQGMRWEDICTDMGYSWRHIHNIHSKILRKIVKSA